VSGTWKGQIEKERVRRGVRSSDELIKSSKFVP